MRERQMMSQNLENTSLQDIFMGDFDQTFVEAFNFQDTINGSFLTNESFTNFNGAGNMSGLNTPPGPEFPVPVQEVKTEEVTSTSAESALLPNSEDRLDLTKFEYTVAPIPSPSSFPNSPPVLVVGFNSWEGDFKFKVSIPSAETMVLRPRMQPKFIFSTTTDKLYVAKNKVFPVNITMDHYPENASIVMCPVFTNATHRMKPVFRCHNCSLNDKNYIIKEHILQLEGSQSGSYFCDHNQRYMVSVPLGTPAPGDKSVTMFLKLTCNTSCVGGPNRKLFSIVFTLKVGDREIGRQVINTKCCAGPKRDMRLEEEAYLQSLGEENGVSRCTNEIRQISSGIHITNRSKTRTSGDRERSVVKISTDDEYELLKVPKRFAKQAKRYINTLHMKEELKRRKLYIQKYYSSEDSTSTSD